MVCKSLALAINLASSHVGGYYVDPTSGNSLPFNEVNTGVGVVCAFGQNENTKLQAGFYRNSYYGLPKKSGGTYRDSEAYSPYVTLTQLWNVAQTDLGTFKLGGSLGAAYYSMGKELGSPLGNFAPIVALTGELEMDDGLTYSVNLVQRGTLQRIAGVTPKPSTSEFIATFQIQIPIGGATSTSTQSHSNEITVTNEDRKNLIEFGNSLHF